MFEQYFPPGIATGSAFLGREKEINQLENNIMQGYHTLLLAPRRYGKTSLARYIIQYLQLSWMEIDFFLAENELSIEHRFLKGIQSIITAEGEPERWLMTLIQFFKSANKTWTVGIKGLQLELIPDNHTTPILQ